MKRSITKQSKGCSVQEKPSKRRRSTLFETAYSRSFVLENADRLRHSQTASERKFASILDALDGGKWNGRYRAQHAFSGKWIADFYIPGIRLVIEIDGHSHHSASQREKDIWKTKDALDLHLSIARFTNDEVWGHLPSLKRRLLKAIDEAEFRVLSSLGPLGLPFSTNSQPLDKQIKRTIKNSKNEWSILPDYNPRIPTPDQSMSYKYRNMKFYDALAIPTIKLIRQCLNSRCNHESVIDLKSAIAEGLVSQNWTALVLEERSVCAECFQNFVLVRLGDLPIKS